MYPTRTPTSDPTDFPTENPSNNPTKEPTDAPTTSPTENPTPAPTKDPTPFPTAAPTKSPSKTPSNFPTSDPTDFPTEDPTHYPTKSPLMNACDVDDVDVVFLVDTSCYNGLNQCNEDQKEFLAEIFSSVIGPNSGARASYIRYDAHQIHMDLSLDATQYQLKVNQTSSSQDGDNSGNKWFITSEDTHLLYEKVRALPFTNTGGCPDMNIALNAAYKQFEIVGKSDENGRDKKIIIVSNHYMTADEQAGVCQKHEIKIKTGSFSPHKDDGVEPINVIMINLGASPSNYISCLVGYDDDRIYEAQVIDMDPTLTLLVPTIQDEICSDPTPAPTLSPTLHPTINPTETPTDSPSESPTNTPSLSPTPAPSDYPTMSPTENPSSSPSNHPTSDPTDFPTEIPSTDPTKEPTETPTESPTDFPTMSPSESPSQTPTISTLAPSESPTMHPTNSPSTPTTNPTAAPTDYPTETPSNAPTPSPNQEACENGGRLDIIFLVDTSVEMTQDECKDKNEFIGELYTSVKGAKNIVRAGLIRFGAQPKDINVDISLDAAPFNTVLPPSQSEMNSIYNFIRNLRCMTSAADSPQPSNVLSEALATAMYQFDVIGDSDALYRDKKIVIVSNSFVPTNEQETICALYEDKIRTGLDDPTTQNYPPQGMNGIDVVMINLGKDIYKHSNYISCLVENDHSRIYEEENVNFDPDLEFLIPEIRDELCSAPTPIPTPDPTLYPTTDPTDFPTEVPSTDPTKEPTESPSTAPSDNPSAAPSFHPTQSPSDYPTTQPTDFPTENPSTDPTLEPTESPTQSPTDVPTYSPSSAPSDNPSPAPTEYPSVSPSNYPTTDPTDFPSEQPTDFPTHFPSIDPTPSPIQDAKKWCPLDRAYEFAIVVDNSCGLSYDECLIQRDQIAELLSYIKADNDEDNPKVAYIEYNDDGAAVRVSLDNPIQRHLKDYYNFIKMHGYCGDGGDGNTDLVSGLDAALNEFEVNGNPNAVKKIITINNCKHRHHSTDDSNEDEPDHDGQNAICNRIHSKMESQNIDGIVINIPAPKDKASNVILTADHYLLCFADNDSQRVCSGRHHHEITPKEYEHAFNKCVPKICTQPTAAPTVDPTSSPTNSPTIEPTFNPTESPTLSPTDVPSTSPSAYPTSDPTDFPTEIPTIFPTDAPSESPSQSPSDSPTSDPTDFPTENPTLRPSFHPTPSPNQAACENGGRLDIVFLIDTSSVINSDECAAQNEFIAELYTSVKGAANIVRAAYIRFGANNQHIVDVALDAVPYNIRDQKPEQKDMNILYNFIRDQSCSTYLGDIDLDSALKAAYVQFDHVGKSDGINTKNNDDSNEDNGVEYLKRDKKIVIVSNNYLTLPQQDEVCNANQDKLRTGMDQPMTKQIPNKEINGINVIMINLRDKAPLNYLMCLVGNDETRIFEAPKVEYPALEDLIPEIRDECCSNPTPMPTVNPTSDPTMDPTDFPSYDPSTDPTESPTAAPSHNPTNAPTDVPSTSPSAFPTSDPTDFPTEIPSTDPTKEPTDAPTESPTDYPTTSPSSAPTPRPTRWPTKEPTKKPTDWPTMPPTRRPTPKPTKKPTHSPTNPACELSEIYEFAIVVDNSCGLSRGECAIQMDQVSELVSLIKKDNDRDNPKITFIEYTAQNANVRISLDDPIQRHTKELYGFIRNNGHCGDGDANGPTNLLNGFDAALNEFELNGNPGAIKKIITINNCKNGHFDNDDNNGQIVYNNDEICNRVHTQMINAEIESIVINVGMKNDDATNYLSCLVDDDFSRICVANAFTEREYRRAYNQCVPEICTGNGIEHTPNPAQVQTPEPTKEGFRYPTNHPSTTESPTHWPTEETMWPTPSPIVHSWPSAKPEITTTATPTMKILTTEITPEPTPNPTPNPTESPSLSPSMVPTMDPTDFPTENPVIAPSLTPSRYPTPEPTGRPTNISTTSTFVPSSSPTVGHVCPICLTDFDVDDEANDPYKNDENAYFAVPLPPKDIVFTAHSVGLNVRDSLPLNVMYTNKDYEEKEGEIVDGNENENGVNVKYILVLMIVSVNLIVFIWFVFKSEKKEIVMGYLAGRKVRTQILSEAQIEDSDEEIEDEYQTSTDVDEVFTDDDDE